MWNAAAHEQREKEIPQNPKIESERIPASFSCIQIKKTKKLRRDCDGQIGPTRKAMRLNMACKRMCSIYHNSDQYNEENMSVSVDMNGWACAWT
jgi:aspartate oxidase